MSGNRTAIWIVLGLWLFAMALSGLAMTAEPTGDGFTRGMNRITGFVGWQAAGLILALIAWLSALALPKGDRLRWMARVPGWWAVVLVVGVAIMIAVGAWVGNRPPPVTDTPENPPPVTAPVV
jgi:hypothetical protein